MLKIGLSNSISQIIMSFSNILLNNLAAGYEDYVISAYGVAGKLISMVYMITVGYISGYMSFAGYTYSANQFKRMLSALRFTILSGTGISFVLLVPFLWLAPAFVNVFTSDAQIMEVSVALLHAYAWGVPFMVLQMSMMCTFQATGSALCAMVVNLGRQCLFTIPFLYLFNRLWGLDGLLYAQMGADICTTILVVVIGIRLVRRLYGMQKKVEMKFD